MVSEQSSDLVAEEAIAELRSRLGTVMKSRDVPYLTEVTRDSIRHWAWGTGDRNPLWLDEEYAAQSHWQGLVAPPTMLFAFDKLTIGYRGGLPGVHSFFGGIEWHFKRYPRLNEQINVEVVFSDLVEMPSRFSGRMLKQVSEVTFTNSDGDVIAVSHPYGFRTGFRKDDSTASRRKKYDHLTPAEYTPDDIDALREEYDREHVQGSKPLWWDDVEVGSSIPSIVRGPQTVSNAIAFYRGFGGWFIMGHGYWYDYLKRHPSAGIPNDQGVPESPSRAHWDSAFARKVGVPAAYDYGPERVAWFGTLLTNWIGDDGFLQRLHVEVRRFNLLGDTTRCFGRVTGKRSEGDAHLVELDLWSVDQRGEQTCKGSATVQLPRSA